MAIVGVARPRSCSEWAGTSTLRPGVSSRQVVRARTGPRSPVCTGGTATDPQSCAGPDVSDIAGSAAVDGCPQVEEAQL